MSGRRIARERAVQFLFQQEFHPEEDMPLMRDEFWKNRKSTTKLETFANEIIDGVMKNYDFIDDQLQGYAENWALERIGGVERNVMRVALYELLFRKDIPPVVTVNEAVEVAKDLSSDEAGKFVNGILDRALKDLNRPLRKSAEEN